MSWQEKEIRLQEAPRGLHRGSTAVDAGSQVLTKLYVMIMFTVVLALIPLSREVHDGDAVYHWRDFVCPTLKQLGYDINYEPLPKYARIPLTRRRTY